MKLDPTKHEIVRHGDSYYLASKADPADGWDYEGYWQAVLGLDRPAQVIDRHELDEAGVSAFLAECERAALKAGGLAEAPASWARHRDVAASTLEAAMLWGEP